MVVKRTCSITKSVILIPPCYLKTVTSTKGKYPKPIWVGWSSWWEATIFIRRRIIIEAVTHVVNHTSVRSRPPCKALYSAQFFGVLGVRKLSNEFSLIASNLIVGDINVISTTSNVTGIHSEFVTAVRTALGGPDGKAYCFICQIGSSGRHCAYGVLYNVADTLYSNFFFTNLGGPVHISKEVNGEFTLVS